MASHPDLAARLLAAGAPRAGRVYDTEKVGRVRTCRLGPLRLEQETAWIEQYRKRWDARFDRLDEVIEQMKRREKGHARK